MSNTPQVRAKYKPPYIKKTPAQVKDIGHMPKKYYVHMPKRFHVHMPKMHHVHMKKWYHVHMSTHAHM